jgi:WXXGXW repeat (2 copies)
MSISRFIKPVKLVKLAKLAVPLGFALAAAGCIVVPAHRARTVYYEQPAAVVEAPPQRANWVPGHYVFRDDAGWVWQPGHYVQTAVPVMPAVIVEPIVVAPSPAHVYVRGYWGWGGANWRWHGGRWAVRGRF